MITPYYNKDGITIYCDDCLEIISKLEFDLVITDPPYGINHTTDYKKRKRGKLANCFDYPKVINDDIEFNPQPFLDWPCILWGANHFSRSLPNSSGWLVWDKERPENLDQSTCELAFTNFVKGVRRFRYLWNGMIRAGDEKLYHPTQKPVALIMWCIMLKWTPGGIIIDPYMGSGTTLVAAQGTGRRAIGIEISEKYCKIAIERLRQKSLIPLLENKNEYSSKH